MGGYVGNAPDSVQQELDYRYAPITRGRRNVLINGDLSIWQRGTGFSGLTSTEYTADRWFANPSGGTVTVQKTQFGAGDHKHYKNGLYFNVTTGADYCAFAQRVENGRFFAGKTVTLSAYALIGGRSDLKARVYLYNATRSENIFPAVNPAQAWSSVHPCDGTTYKKVSFTFVLPDLSAGTTWLPSDALYLVVIPVDQYTSTDPTPWSAAFFELQLEIGDTATDFEYRSEAEELALCQRYFRRDMVLGNGLGHRYGAAGSTSMQGWELTFPVTMRASPTVTVEAAPTFTNCVLVDYQAFNGGAIARVNVTAAGTFRVSGGTYAFDAEI